MLGGNLRMRLGPTNKNKTEIEKIKMKIYHKFRKIFTAKF